MLVEWFKKNGQSDLDSSEMATTSRKAKDTELVWSENKINLISYTLKYLHLQNIYIL